MVADRGAVDTELGGLKTGKEADLLLLGGEEHRTSHRSAGYAEGRRVRNTRDARAMVRKSRHGREVAARQWAWAEWEALRRFRLAGVPVPCPVQVDGTEILMELVTVDGEPARRLASTRPDRALL